MGKFDNVLKKANIEKIGQQPQETPKIEVSETLSKESPFEKIKKVFSRSKTEIEKAKDSSYTPGTVDFRVIVYHRPDSLPAEHFKVLRAKIMYPKDGRRLRSVLITSALESEGKTMVSCNLAVSIAQSIDPWVLLIDGDIRRASVHKTLGLKKSAGLTDYLITGNPLSNYLMKGILDKMTVLQAGSVVRNPAELMTSEKMAMLLDEVKKRYDDRFIIIDSPPVNLAAETLVLAKHVDAVIMVIRYSVSDRNAVAEAIKKIGKEKILGFVFNGFEVRPRKYTYYKNKYYHIAY